ncbi:MAG TPA: tRNA (adenosine(37)-N6)-threonylcarbamoyltransferase complex ATPase subunit type 1 TsaE [Phycisphaerales bacterium]|nr:tRNA (adenosine(37)-N6)-threonylcarbamoyltransferase complex ATPase subunit type 1 TsaE [Phycisphaerales bacterium]HRQ75120.1 tRNA (adenosine(37)-N6)-threonylcarbamoyltransferase complex ATPase subunit type 1 TsaE [Phycisphaerales bacterium]
MKIERITHDPMETMHFASTLASYLRGGDVIALDGPLGAGKTCFVRGLAQGLGVNPAEVSSPTFIICHEYQGRSATLAHLDLYRVAGEDELESIGWDEFVTSKDTILAIEWPSRAAAALSGLPLINVSLEHIDSNRRRLTLSVEGEMARRLEDFHEAFTNV